MPASLEPVRHFVYSSESPAEVMMSTTLSSQPVRFVHPMSTHHSFRPDPLSISEMAEFDRNIESDDDRTQRRKRIAYMNQALKGYRLIGRIFQFWWVMLLPVVVFSVVAFLINPYLALLPIFFAGGIVLIALFLRQMIRERIDDHLQDALDYWSLDRADLDRM